ncbi:AAA family ATPase [Chryseolinea soli]|uniref:AAA+ ATPase domain-containing protein n=1 Tax=Chryseolinea soli TaxID=2321403 RepID=A0A385SIU2_9BACT|nr:AAA family ATPase [Chryseolinea soli]AYB31663.1 hypothetical protein D4L85_14310 [Chryseolinea soli]
MIYINRGAEPGIFKSDRMMAEFNAAREFYNAPIGKRRQQRFEFRIYSSKEIREAISRTFNGKCAFCESSVVATSPGEIENFRPKGGAVSLSKTLDPDHYWWLCYEWRNLYLSCSICGRAKRNIFPVEGKRANLLAAYEEVLREKSLLVDPCHDLPEEHITFDETGLAISLSRKGEATIEIFLLNRKPLVEQRLMAIKTLQFQMSEIESTLELIKSLDKKNAKVGTALQKSLDDRMHSLMAHISPTEPYIAQKKVIIQKWLKSKFDTTILELNEKFLEKLIEKGKPIKKPASTKVKTEEQRVTTLVSKKGLPKIKSIRTQKLFLEKIEIYNFKSIENITVNFPSYDVVNEMGQDVNETHDKYEPWLMLLGENGVGKSSFLQAIALTLMGKKYLSKHGIKANHILRHGAGSGFVKIYHQESIKPISIKFSKGGGIRSDYTEPISYLLGYGSTRLFPTRLLREEKATGKIKVKNMFSYDVALADSRGFILEVYKKSKTNKKYEDLFHNIGRAIRDLLLLKGPEELVVIRGEVYIDYGNKKRDTLDELSDGYKSVVAVTVDIIKALWKDNVVFDTAQGIVLLDEIGTHLHPRWRMQVVKKFRNVFPGLQFIVTTHDPLCLRGLKKGEIVVFDKDENRRVFAIDDLPDSSEYRVDQLLTSPFFGLSSVVDPALEKEFNEYYLLLRKAEPSPDEKTRMEVLEAKLTPRMHLGSTWREELIYKAVDEVIAKSDIKTPDQFAINSNQGTNKEQGPTGIAKSANEIRRKAEDDVRTRIRALWNKKEST